MRLIDADKLVQETLSLTIRLDNDYDHGVLYERNRFLKSIADQPDVVLEKKTHEIKLELEFCDAVFRGNKPFEIRLDDRNYQVGDRIQFAPVRNGMPAKHPISHLTYEITYLLRGWGLKDGYVAFGIVPVEKEDICEA